MKYRYLLPIAMAGFVLNGCSKEATGQVAAVVGGEEITLQEVNAEIAGMAVPDGADKKLLQQQALQRIVERKLMAQAARKDGLDKTQDYLLREQQLRETLLVLLAGQKAERALQVPDQQAIDKFIADHPAMFGNRVILVADSVQFSLPGDTEAMNAFKSDNSMDAVLARLNALKIQYSRANRELDSARMSEEQIKRIRALAPGEVFAIPSGAAMLIGVVTSERPAPLAGEAARPVAVQALRREQLGKILQQRLAAARSGTEIKYQDGFAPPAENTAK